MVSNWITKELEGIEFGDKRLNKRVLTLLDKASKQPQASINRMFHTRKHTFTHKFSILLINYCSYFK